MNCVLAVLISGLTDIFGVGTWKIADELEKIRYVQVVKYGPGLIGIYNLDSIISKIKSHGHCRLAIISHSKGGNIALQIAQTLYDENWPVDLLVTFDPAARLEIKPIRANTSLAINYYQTTSLLGRGRISKSPANMNTILVERKVDLLHVIMPSDPGLIKETVADVRELVRRK